MEALRIVGGVHAGPRVEDAAAPDVGADLTNHAPDYRRTEDLLRPESQGWSRMRATRVHRTSDRAIAGPSGAPHGVVSGGTVAPRRPRRSLARRDVRWFAERPL